MFSKEDTNKVKGIAIILLLFHHCFLGPARYKGQDVSFFFPEGVVNKVSLSFRICVAIFTFLSAYGITLSLKKRAGGGDLSAKDASAAVIHRLTSLIGGYFFVFILVEAFGTFVMHDGLAAVYGSGPKALLYWCIDAMGMAGLMNTPLYYGTWWYMSLAIAVILIMPIFYAAYRKVGPIVMLGSTFLIAALIPVDNSWPYESVELQNYLFCIGLGLLAAEENLLCRLRESAGIGDHRMADQLLKSIVLFLLMAASLYFRERTKNMPIQVVFEGLSSFFVVSFCYTALNRLPFLGRALEFAGRYSADVYLVHNLIRVVWFYDFTYSFRYPLLITAVLLVSSLLVSYLLSLAKEYSGYNRLVKKLADKLTRAAAVQV